MISLRKWRTGKMDELEQILKEIPGAEITRRELIELTTELIEINGVRERLPVVTICHQRKHAGFHEYWIDRAEDPVLKPLIDYLDKNGYTTNLN